MQRTTRWIGLVWLALVLNVLSPVIGYARLAPAAGEGLLSVELCSAAGAHRVVVIGSPDANHDRSFDHGDAPHCAYCPGFAANVALGASLPVLPGFVRAFVQASPAPSRPIFARSAIRFAQPRAPPDSPLI